jgi:hypothetical protein
MDRLILILLACAGSIYYWPYDHFRNTQVFGLIVLLLILSFKLLKEFGLSIALLFFHSASYGVYVMHFSNGYYKDYFHNICAVSGRATLTIVLMAVLALYLNPAYKKLHLVAYLGLLNSFLVLGHGYFYGGFYGMLNNHSFDATFIACCYPIIAFIPSVNLNKISIKEYIWIFICAFVPLIAIIKVGQSSAYAVLFTSMAAYILSHKKSILLSISTILVGLFFSIYRLKDTAFEGSGRFGVWDSSIILFNDMDSKISGFGIGTAEWMIPFSQIRANGGKFPSDFFTWMHNDYLQVLFEQGYIGLILLIIICINSIYKSYKLPWLFSTVIALLVAMSTQMPFRYMPFQIFIICVTILVSRYGTTNKI